MTCNALPCTGRPLGPLWALSLLALLAVAPQPLPAVTAATLQPVIDGASVATVALSASPVVAQPQPVQWAASPHLQAAADGWQAGRQGQPYPPGNGQPIPPGQWQPNPPGQWQPYPPGNRQPNPPGNWQPHPPGNWQPLPPGYPHRPPHAYPPMQQQPRFDPGPGGFANPPRNYPTPPRHYPSPQRPWPPSGGSGPPR